MTQSVAVLGAGTRTFWRSKGEKKWQTVPGLTAIGEVGNIAPTVEVTSLADRAKRYMAGVFDAPEKELKGYYYGKASPEQAAFVNAALAGMTVEMCHLWFTTPITVGVYEVALLGFKLDETQNESAVTFMVSGKQNGMTNWEQPVPDYERDIELTLSSDISSLKGDDTTLATLTATVKEAGFPLSGAPITLTTTAGTLTQTDSVTNGLGRVSATLKHSTAATVTVTATYGKLTKTLSITVTSSTSG